MAFNDFLKKAKETASNAMTSAMNAADSAKEMINEQKAKIEAERAERERVRAELQAQADSEAEIFEAQFSQTEGTLFAFDKQALKAFTEDYYDKLYLNTYGKAGDSFFWCSHSKKVDKIIKKNFATYFVNDESLLVIIDHVGTVCMLTDKNIYLKKEYGDGTVNCIIRISVDNIESLSYLKDGDEYVFSCNDIELFRTKYESDKNSQSFNDYITRIKERDFEISEKMIDSIIRARIKPAVKKIVDEYVFDDELFLFCADGYDGDTANDYIICTDKQIVIIDRETFGLTKNVRQFFFENINSMATKQETEGFFDLTMSLLGSCKLEINAGGAKETIDKIYNYEAEKIIRIFREKKRQIKENANKPQVIIQQVPEQKPAEDDPISLLQKLATLKDAGIISEEEFNAKKVELLSKI